MSLAILFHFLCAQHVSDINILIIRSLQLHRNSNTHRTNFNLNFLAPSGPVQACNGTALPLPYLNTQSVPRSKQTTTRL